MKIFDNFTNLALLLPSLLVFLAKEDKVFGPLFLHWELAVEMRESHATVNAFLEFFSLLLPIFFISVAHYLPSETLNFFLLGPNSLFG